MCVALEGGNGSGSKRLVVKDAQVEGVVTAQLPSGLYQVEVEGPHRITAHLGGKRAGGTERNFVRVLVGDRVVVELTPRDTTRGRIVRKAT